MGRGRKPLPTAVKQLRGNPGKRALNDAEPKPKLGRPPMPVGLSEVARNEWERIVPLLEEMGVLAVVDGAALAAYCQTFARWLQAEREIEENGITFITKFQDEHGNLVEGDIKKNPAVTVSNEALRLMRAFLSEYGMTPSSRSRLKVGDKPEDDPLEKFLKGGSSPQAGDKDGGSKPN